MRSIQKGKGATMSTPLAPFSHGARLGRPCAAVAAAFVFLVAGAGCAKRPASISVPLKYRPTSQLKMAAFAGDIPESKVQLGPVTDNRPDKERVGENLEEKDPVAVQTGDDPTEFVRTRLADLLSKTGLQVVPDAAQADRVLLTELHTFWVKETNTYESEIRATFIVQDRTGKRLWKGTMNGTAERFGRSLSAENYQEVFSDGMVDLVQNLLSNQKFREALGKAPGA
jgi:hypothetical protein